MEAFLLLLAVGSEVDMLAWMGPKALKNKVHSELKEPLFFEEVFTFFWYNLFFKAMVILG